MKNLNEIIHHLKTLKLIISSIQLNTEINHITYDSNDIQNNTLFFCKGARFKKEYLESAIQQGCIAYVSEVDYQVDCPLILVEDIRKTMLETAAFFYDYPDRHLKLIGITGTKGKSTTATFVKSILDYYLVKQHKKCCGLISTIHTFDGIEDYESTLTTPEAFGLYRNLANAVKAGLEYMVIEVSSQALKYQRVNTVQFDVVALLNLGRDHISPIEHPTQEDYIQSKLKIFELSKTAIINDTIDYQDQICQKLQQEQVTFKTYSLTNPKADIFCQKKEIHRDLVKFWVDNNLFQFKMLGDYNIENALCAIGIVKEFGIDMESMSEGLSKANVEGRFGLYISQDEERVAMVSYAHNGISLEKLFEIAKQQFNGYQIISLFGASGGKSINRREDLTKVACKYSQKIYFVPDDPGYESFEDITQQMIHYIENDCPYEVYDNREQAIIDAMSQASGKTVFILAGKGTDAYQIIQGKYIPTPSDDEVAQAMITQYDQQQEKPH